MRTGIILLFAVFAFSTFSMTQSSHTHNRTATDSVRLLYRRICRNAEDRPGAHRGHTSAFCRMICSKAAVLDSGAGTLQPSTSPLNLRLV